LPIVIGLDLGTTNAKAIALEQDGRVAATASQGYPMHTPHPGQAEQDPQAVWQGAVEALHELAGQLNAEDIAGLCLSGAMHSSLPVGADGTPLAPALTWADQRAAGLARQLRRQTDTHSLYQRTGCPLQPIYHIAKLRWWVEMAPEITHRTAFFVTIKDYVLHCLTGAWLGDFSVYSATGLLDIHRCTWDDEALMLAGVTAGQLPPLGSPLALAGHLTENSAKLTGLPAHLPVILGASDGGLANLGAGVSRPGQSVITVGTSGAVRRIAAEPYLDVPATIAGNSLQPQERTWCYLLTEGRWFAGGAINNGGLAVQWVREKFYPELSSTEGYLRMFTDAAEISPGSAGVTLLPYFAGERSPYWNADARATITGLGLEHDRRHVARAVLEGVAYRLGEIWEALGETGSDEPARLTGGILQSPDWAQIVCDVIGFPLAAVETGDASAIGAAMLGFAALELAPSLEKQASRILPGMSWQPNPDNHTVYRAGFEWFRKLYAALYTSDQ
jgi:gluconokinase